MYLWILYELCALFHKCRINASKIATYLYRFIIFGYKRLMLIKFEIFSEDMNVLISRNGPIMMFEASPLIS